MLKPEPAGGLTPQLFFQTANAYQRSQALQGRCRVGSLHRHRIGA